ncbi:MAG TPA: bacillithiol biosynthesis cysteine-adding enzyme BshC [Vicinamibacteria bacterium]|nr:bacillithiol biosynthesis cysteine-adding enzyme BshC [Vicinamibacteria bacterium]
MAAPPVSLDYGSFLAPPSRLFLDYLQGGPAARRFFEGGFEAADLAAAASRALVLPRPRAAVAEALVRQQRARGAEAAARVAERLNDPRAVAVVTGQQAVLFGGPLLVLYKALAAVKAAEELEPRHQAPVVPVFWVASDDHDFEEMRSVEVLDPSGGLKRLRYAPAADPSGLPAWGIALDPSVETLLAELAAALPETEGREATLLRLRRCYRTGVSFSDAFAGLLSSLLPSLVVLDPADPALKALMTPLLRREIEERSPTTRLAAGVGTALDAAGYHEQVAVREGFLNAFAIERGARRALAVRDGEVEVRGTGRRMSVAEAVAWLEREPEAFSPGALLRPLVQDALLPTAAYVGGPAEVAYHAQIGPSYAHFGIPRPALVPRPGATLLEPAQARALEAEGLTLVELQRDPEAVLARWARESHPGVDEAFVRARAAIERELHAVEEALGAVDPTLKAAAHAAKGRALHQVEGLEEKATRALKKRDLGRAERLRRTRDALFPAGEPQERRIALAAFVARWGEPLVDTVRERLDVFARAHQVIAL